MSSKSWVTESDEDFSGTSKAVKVALVERYCNDFKDANAQCRPSQEENYLNIFCLQRLPSCRSSPGAVGSYVRLSWYWDSEMDFLEDKFKIVQPSEFDIVLGARACQRMKEIDEKEGRVYFATMFMANQEKKSKSKEQKARDAAAEARRLAELKERNQRLAQQELDEMLADFKSANKGVTEKHDSSEGKGKGKAQD